MSFQITEVLIDHEKSPLGIDTEHPAISWKMQADACGTRQSKYRIAVFKKRSGEAVWDTGIQEDSRSIGIRYNGKKLEAETPYTVSLEVWDQSGERQEASCFFETGLMDPSPGAWEGAKWIGAPEFYVAADTMSVFSIESEITFEEGRGRAGIIFGGNDKRLLDPSKNEMLLKGKSYISYVLDVTQIPAKIDIYRVGYEKNDTDDIPFASISVISETTMEPVITEDNRFLPHVLKIQVMGNAAYAFVDQVRVDSVKRRTFSGEKTAPRQLNPLGFNDVTTYPRLCDIGYYVEKGTKATFSGLTIRNVRKPRATIAKFDTDNGRHFHAAKDNIFEVFNPSAHSLPMLRRDFTADGEIESARLYATARGIYTVWLNGKKLTDQYFMPGASQYDKHLMYQTFDVTDVVVQGINGIGFTLASGWWSEMSTYGLYNYNYWGDKPSLLAKLVVTYKDGARHVVTTDCENWQYFGEGPFLYSGFFNGEQFDGRKRWIYTDCSRPGFRMFGMKQPEEIAPVAIWAEKPSSPLLPGWEHVNLTEPEITGSLNAPVRAVERLHPKRMSEPVPGVYIYDLGQEIAGIASIHFHGTAGTKAWIRYGEMLYPDLPEYGELSGRMLQANLREASNTDMYILSGGTDDIFCPEFTFHGFRYIEVSGIDIAPSLDDVTGILLSSVETVTGKFECSNPLVNRLAENVRYSMLSNYISIPTDCPQRNERMGWCGDTHVFAKTAAYHSNVKNFLSRNLQAMKDLQRENGHLPNVAPVGGGFGGITYESAMIIIVWELYQQYGDVEIIKEYYGAMDRWMKTMEEEGMPGEQYTGFLGDWLAPDETDNHLVWNAFYGRDARYMKHFSEILGFEQEKTYYAQKEEEAIKYWNHTFVDERSGITKCLNGTTCDTQGSYAIGLDCGMFEDAYKDMAVNNLVRKVQEAGYTVRTGFFGTGPLNKVLTENGRHDTAYRLITQTAYPSWLYPVTQGATTIWERWDSFTEKNGFGSNNAMNSFNHYSLGSVLSWCYEWVLGIQREEAAPGFTHCCLRPQVYGFSYARGAVDTPYGTLESSWEQNKDGITYSCFIPVNMTAELELNQKHWHLESGRHQFHLPLEEGTVIPKN